MAINSIKYNKHHIVINDGNIKYPSVNFYKQANENYGDFPFQYITWTPLITSRDYNQDVFQDYTLMTLANGDKAIAHYSLSVNDTYTMYKMKLTLQLKSKAGTVIQSTGQTETTRSWAENYPRKPFSKVFFYFSYVSFITGVNTVAGDPAQYVYLGYAFAPREYDPVDPFEGSTKLDTFSQQYFSLGGAMTAHLYDDNDWSSVRTTITNGGDGTPWDETGDEPEEPDPSKPGGGDRPRNDQGDPVDYPALPTGSAIDTGFVSAYNPDNSLLRQLATKLWSNDFITTISKVMNDPFDAIIGLSMIPFNPTTSGSVNVMIGNYDSQISMPIISVQYTTLDCGTLTIGENWNNALDYNATTAEIFIPFVGFRSLNIQDVMNKTLGLKYNVDVLTGVGVAILKAGNKVLYTWPCNMAYDIPITGSNKQALYTGLINVAMTGAGGLAAGGVMGGVMGAANSAINVATHSQSNVERSGSVVSNTSVLSEFTPYVVLHRPKQSMAQNFKQIKGYQSNITKILNVCQGYTEIEYIHLTGIDGATDTELEEIESLLKEGVII